MGQNHIGIQKMSNQKYNADGYLTPKEQEKLAKDRERYDKAVIKLHRDS